MIAAGEELGGGRHQAVPGLILAITALVLGGASTDYGCGHRHVRDRALQMMVGRSTSFRNGGAIHDAHHSRSGAGVADAMNSVTQG